MEADQVDGPGNPYMPGTRLSVDQVVAFRRFNSYPWMNDRGFLLGLDATAGKVDKGPGGWSESQIGISVQARIWHYSGKFGIALERPAYDQYVAENPEEHRPDVEVLDRLATIQALMRAEYVVNEAPATHQAESAAQVAVPAWQMSAPAADLTRKADDHAAPAAYGQAAPQPRSFEQIMEAVKNGQTVPGVREITSHVARVPGLSPVGKMTVPPKPWEKKEVQQSNNDEDKVSTVLDPEFPSLEADEEHVEEKGPKEL